MATLQVCLLSAGMGLPPLNALYSNHSSDYTIGPPIGFGASSVVYAAKYQSRDGTTPIPCALKVLDLDRLPPSALRLLQNETQLMSLSKHPNVLRVRGTWVDGHKLYIAMRLMNAGSVADVMRYQWPGGLEEEVIRCILKQALQGLKWVSLPWLCYRWTNAGVPLYSYFHINGLIHRDVKAANLLIDDDGTVLLGDLGVAAFLWDSGGPQPSKSRTINFDPLIRSSQNSHKLPHQRAPAPSATPQRPSILGKRKSFVGTPCWMAPEVINGKTYDASADIWSFGITAIELAQGRAPRSRLDPHKVLVMTVTDAPPQLERSAGPHSYSSAFAETVGMCLNKDPTKRPTAADLLQTHFFKNARKPAYLCSAILRDLPPLTQRQERRKQPSIHTHLTMDSWDFSVSLPASPTTSIYSHHRRPIGLVPPQGLFEMEGEAPPDSDDGGRGVDVGDQAEGDHAAIDGHSSAEAYAVRIRARHRSSLSVGRSLHLHSRSGSHHSLHSHHSHSRRQSHDDRPTVHSIQEVVIQPADEDEDESSDTDRNQERSEARGIPVAISPAFATLDVPAASQLSVSPAASMHSSTSAASSASSPLTPSTPPLSSSLGSTAGVGKSQRGKLWRKLTGKLEVGEPDGWNASGKAKDRAAASPLPPSSAGGGRRKKSFGSVFGRTASMSADLVRTASRTMSRECQ